MLTKSWRNRAIAAVMGTLLAVTLVPGEAHAVQGLYMDTRVRPNVMIYDFGSQVLTGGKSQVPGRIYTPYIYTLYAYDLSVYASSQGSGGVATLQHGASASKRSGCKWNYLSGSPPGTHHLTCWYYAP
jgi:hypothetical protein